MQALQPSFFSSAACLSLHSSSHSSENSKPCLSVLIMQRTNIPVSMANSFLSIPIFFFFLTSIILLFTTSASQPLQLVPSQSQAVLNLRHLLNYPPSLLTNWNEATDFCNSDPNPSLTVVCYEENVTQLHISGVGWSHPHELPQNFSSHLLFANLANLPSLKVLSLVSLGLFGPLPASISSISSLEILNLTSNYFSGDLPLEVSSLVNLQTLVLVDNKFSGEIAVWFSSLPLLTVLSLSNNSFHGSVPASLARLQNLRILKLGMNNLTGEVPNLTQLTNLQILDLRENKLGPRFPSLPNKLIHLILRKNMFQFIIPENLTSFYHLETLDISMNDFIGPFKPQLLSLPSLSYLDISSNKLTGFLFENTSCSDVLDYVNLSSNRLTGDLPTCLSKRMVFQYDGNCLNHSQGQKQHSYVYCHNEALAVNVMPRDGIRKPVNTSVIVLALVGGIGFGLVLCSLLFVFAGRWRNVNMVKEPQTRMILERVNPANTIKMLTDARYISETMKIGALGLPPYRTFVLEELKEATNDFSLFNLVGEGSLGRVYKGTLADGTMVAIKSLKIKKKHSTQSYTRQIESISKLRHCNLISAIGHCFECCSDGSSVITLHLLFEYVTNGTTLRDCISERTVSQMFRWTQRIAAAIGVAKGIQFLHTGIVPGIFSNNLKITDVMLDHNLMAKISTCNIPFLNEVKRMVSSGSSSSSSSLESKDKMRVGNEDKKDIYDFGVILLELIMGRAIMSANAILVARDLLRVSLKADDVVGRRGIIDPSIQKDSSDESLKTLMEICLRCLLDEPSNRPSIEDVVWNLQFAAQVQDSWKSSCQGSPNVS